MKRIFMFLGLKIVEISGLVFLPYYIGKWNPLNLAWNHCNNTMPETIFQFWGTGFVYIICSIIIFLVGWFLIWLNWGITWKLS